MKENQTKLYKLLGKILKLNLKKINKRTSPDNAGEWDSFNGLMIVAETEKQFGVNFSIDEVVNIRNVGDIIKSLRKKGIKV